MTADLQKKIDRAVRLIRSMAPEDGSPIEVAYSGGKDSDVCLELTRMAGVNYQAIYRNTTIDPPGTIAHVEEVGGVRMVRPETSFFKLVEQMGFPNHQQRFCCRYLKEYKILDRCIMGIRRCESTKRQQNYEEPTECKLYGAKRDEQYVQAVYPILEWSDKDVVDFIRERGIKVHPLYYRPDGTVDPSRRLGCMCCPLAYYKKRIKAFKEHPGMVRQYIRAGQRFRETHPDVETITMYADVFEWFTRDLFFETQAKWDEHKNSMFNDGMDYKQFLSDYFHVNLDGI